VVVMLATRSCSEVMVGEDTTMEKEEERLRSTVVREKNEAGKIGVRAGCFSNFGFRFLPSQTMKSTHIYGWWKRDILSLMVPNIGPLFDSERS